MVRGRGLLSTLLGLAAIGAVTPSAHATVNLSICYMNHPVILANMAILEKWAARKDIHLIKTPVAYTVYLPKITQMLSSGGSDQCDIIWNNDDWGQDLAQYLVATDDIPDIKNVESGQLEPFFDDGKPTTVPITTTSGIFFYRTDLIPDEKLPRTWDDMVKISQELQKAGKVRWGYVGGMSYTNTYFSFWWTLWNNDCDMYEPRYERDNKILMQADWKSMFGSDCQKQTAEFWWDALHTHKISPPGMTTYSRDEANALFEAGQAAFTVADTTFLGTFNDPSKSKVAGKVGMARFPQGPRSKGQRTWTDIWGWSIPKAVPTEHQKAAKELLGAMMTDLDGQLEQWKSTGGPPPNTKAWEQLQESDPVWQRMADILFKSEHVHDAYYFRQWAALHKVYSDILIGAMNGERGDIPKALAAGVAPMHDGAPK